MFTLFDYLPSQNGWKVRQLLAHLGRPYRTELVAIFDGEGQNADFLRINPTGTVPAIRLDDGRTLAESNAILAFLAEGTPYLPGDAFARAKVLQWLSFEQERVESTIGALRHWRLTGKLGRRPPELVAMKHEAALRALALLDAELETRAFIAGDAYTIADIAVFAYAAHAEEAGCAVHGLARFDRWLARVRAQPGHLATTYAYATDPHSSRELPRAPLRVASAAAPASAGRDVAGPG
ncbi:glutathione S-transferase family protein [Dokdonella sp.]|uniref:glutathione S-transferase family protein n=1 Tax=Dokdonella sp. TaxID=2291710 RepID=UPI002F4000C0